MAARINRTHEAYGSPLGEVEIALTKQRFGWDSTENFFIPDDALASFRLEELKGAAAEAGWQSSFKRYSASYPELAREFEAVSNHRLPDDWESIWTEQCPVFDPETPLATREAQGRVLDALMPRLSSVMGGSADLTPSNNTRFKGAEDFSPTNRAGRYLRYGVREHGMGAIMNGIALSALIPYAGTFFCFSDYLRPTIRLAALSKYPTIFVFTHDSIGLGEDGPTHQPVEHLAALRAIPGLVTLRPADANETAWAWKVALERRHAPTALVLGRQKLAVFVQQKYGRANGTARGAYVLRDAPEPRVLLMGTGSEVHLAVAAAELLAAKGVSARVISMPSWELFAAQPNFYRETVLPESITARVAVEAGVQMGWERYLGTRGRFIGMSGFGALAPAERLYQEFGITAEAVASAALESIQ